MSGVVEVEDGERYLLKHLGRDRAIEYVNRVLRGAVDPCGGRDKLWWRCVRASLLNPRGAHMPNPTPSDRVREARDNVWLWCGDKERTGAEWDAALDAYAAAIRAECAAEIAALRDTVRSLNRRCQQAESVALVTVAECERHGVSLGRSLAGFAYAMAKREVEALKADRERLDWLNDNAYRDLRIDEWNTGVELGEGDSGPLLAKAPTLREAIDAARASEPRGRE